MPWLLTLRRVTVVRRLAKVRSSSGGDSALQHSGEVFLNRQKTCYGVDSCIINWQTQTLVAEAFVGPF